MRVQSLKETTLVRKSDRVVLLLRVLNNTDAHTYSCVASSSYRLRICAAARRLCTRLLKPSVFVLPRSARYPASTEADPLAERISTSACAARSEQLQSLLTPRSHVLQTARTMRRQPQSLLCDASRNPRARSCVGRSTPDRQGTVDRAPTD